jgi:hypothetical protein
LEISYLGNHRADDRRAVIAQTQQIVEVAFNLPCMRMSKSLPQNWPAAACRLFGSRTGDKIQNVSLQETAFSALLVGLIGLEPMTLRLSSACSNQLSYRPMIG